jgi:hypothetical protein
MIRIPLRNRKKEIVDYALIDDEDEEMVNKYNWHIYPRASGGYAPVYTFTRTSSKPLTLYLGRYLMGENLPPGYEVDHINRNTLDNRKENLRIASRSINSRNRRVKQTIYPGVCIHYRKKDGSITYKAQSRNRDGKCIFLRCGSDPKKLYEEVLKPAYYKEPGVYPIECYITNNHENKQNQYTRLYIRINRNRHV